MKAAGQCPEVLAEAVIQQLEEGKHSEASRHPGTAWYHQPFRTAGAAESNCEAKLIGLGSSGAEGQISKVIFTYLSF